MYLYKYFIMVRDSFLILLIYLKDSWAWVEIMTSYMTLYVEKLRKGRTAWEMTAFACFVSACWLLFAFSCLSFCKKRRKRYIYCMSVATLKSKAWWKPSRLGEPENDWVMSGHVQGYTWRRTLSNLFTKQILILFPSPVPNLATEAILLSRIKRVTADFR